MWGGGWWSVQGAHRVGGETTQSQDIRGAGKGELESPRETKGDRSPRQRDPRVQSRRGQMGRVTQQNTEYSALGSSVLPCVLVGMEPDVEGDNNRTYFVKQNLKIKERSADSDSQMWKDLQGCAPCALGLEHSPLGSLPPRPPMVLICLHSSPSRSCFPLVPGQK